MLGLRFSSCSLGAHCFVALHSTPYSQEARFSFCSWPLTPFFFVLKDLSRIMSWNMINIFCHQNQTVANFQVAQCL